MVHRFFLTLLLVSATLGSVTQAAPLTNILLLTQTQGGSETGDSSEDARAASGEASGEASRSRHQSA